MSEEEKDLTEDEMGSCWYCHNCDTPMRDNAEGVADTRKSLHCSDECAEKYENEWYVD